MSSTDAAPPESIDASPTKWFFVEMLIRDVDLVDAVIDLIDNSVDAARAGGNGDMTDAEVSVSVQDGIFRALDNCGGMSTETAREYAFRFGRPRTRVTGQATIGRFGVGMKRSIFKLGDDVLIRSSTGTEAFEVDFLVHEWAEEDEAVSWTFPIEHLDPANVPRGTLVQVSDLHEEPRRAFEDEAWWQQLRDRTRLAHLDSLGKGLRLVIQGETLTAPTIELIDDEHFQPTVATMTLGGVSVRILAGLGSSGPPDAGWYVFCNGRLVLGPDRTSRTIWEGRGRTVRGGIPAYHDQYARFRGYIWFESDDPAQLPWNTTKTGLDSSSRVWSRAQRTMKDITRQYIDFLNEIKKQANRAERVDDTATDEDSREGGEFAFELLDQAVAVAVRDDLDEPQEARLPPVELDALPEPRVWLRFDVEREELDYARQLMEEPDIGNSEVGRRCFDYFLESEGYE